MKTSVIISAFATAAISLCAACSSCSETEHTEGITAEITAAQMEGRSAARAFVSNDWKDTIQLQHRLLEARSRQSKYIIDGKPECAAAFDSAFISTIRAVRPDLARSIKR